MPVSSKGPGLHALLPAYIVLGVAAGCSSSTDGAFRVEVVGSLRMAGTIEAKLGPHIGEASEDSSADNAVIAFKVAVENLPTPREKKLRYLSMRLTALRIAAEDLRRWYGLVGWAAKVSSERDASLRSPASEDSVYMGVWKEAWASERRFQDALALLAAAERVCLGTSMLADQARAVWLRGSGESTEAYIRTTDSALVATEKLVRGEIARVR